MGVPAQYFIDVRDTAKLHVAALVDNETSNERLWGFAEPYNWNIVLDIFRRLWPRNDFVSELPGLAKDESTLPTESALKALKAVFGKLAWTKLETSLEQAGYDRK
jgi:hypothetical protein